ncbi:MAG: nucleotidyltransferase family protein, partial [Anaerolineae bacterium]|nr:nucleotidyltransferase family protein [Anaerolineae bacterium]
MRPDLGPAPGDEWARIMAHMIYPERPVAGALPEWLPTGGKPAARAQLLRAMRANKLPLLSLDLQVPALAAFYASAEFQQALGEERQSWGALRHEYGLVRAQFDQAGIRDVMIKMTGLPPSLAYRSDNLDVLVDIAQGPMAREALLGLGYVELRNVEEPHKFLFRKFHHGRSVSAIHLHEFVGWGTGFMDDREVLARAQRSEDDDAVTIPSPEDGLLITLAHAFFEDKEVKLGDLWKVLHVLRYRAASPGDLDWDQMYAQVARRGWLAGLDACLWIWSELEQRLYGEHSFPEPLLRRARERAPAWSKRYLDRRLAPSPEGPQTTSFPFGISFRYSKRHYYGKVLADQAISRRQKVVDIARHSWAGIERRLPFHLQRPMLVTFSGVDGCGKTTQAEALRQACETCDLRTTLVWSRGASSPLTDAIIRVAKAALGEGRLRSDAAAPASDSQLQEPRRQAGVARKRRWLRDPLLRTGWIGVTLADLVLRYGMQVAWPSLRGDVVIGDRYLQDALVELAVLTDRMGVA